MIKDSGDRTMFPSGAVRDLHGEDKGRMDLLPWAAIIEVSKHASEGSKKYGEHNVDLGIPTHSLCDSSARHLAKYLDGQTDENHLVAAVWNLLWAVQMVVKNPECVDTPWKKPEQGVAAKNVEEKDPKMPFTYAEYEKLRHEFCKERSCEECPLYETEGASCDVQSDSDRELIRKVLEEYANANLRDKTMRMLREGLFNAENRKDRTAIPGAVGDHHRGDAESHE